MANFESNKIASFSSLKAAKIELALRVERPKSKLKTENWKSRADFDAKTWRKVNRKLSCHKSSNFNKMSKNQIYCKSSELISAQKCSPILQTFLQGSEFGVESRACLRLICWLLLWFTHSVSNSRPQTCELQLASRSPVADSFAGSPIACRGRNFRARELLAPKSRLLFSKLTKLRIAPETNSDENCSCKRATDAHAPRRSRDRVISSANARLPAALVAVSRANCRRVKTRRTQIGAATCNARPATATERETTKLLASFRAALDANYRCLQC